MDPNETLKQLRDLLETWNEFDHTPMQAIELLSHVADSAQTLDQWISGGGFLPEDWQREHECQHGTWCVG